MLSRRFPLPAGTGFVHDPGLGLAIEIGQSTKRLERQKVALAGVAMLALEHRMHDDAGNALAQPGREALPVRLQTRHSGGRAPGRRQPLGNRRDVRGGQVRREPAPVVGQDTQAGRRAPSDETASCNIAVRIPCRIRSRACR